MEVSATAEERGAVDGEPKVSGPEDIGSVYDLYFRRVYTYVRCRVRGREAADDVTSEAFERILTGLGSYRAQKGPLGAWVFAVARNVVTDHLRSRAWRGWLGLDEIPEPAGAEAAPDELFSRGEGRQALEAVLASLDERERDLLALKFAAGMTNRAIAALTGLGESNVAVIVFRAVRKLRDRWKGEGA